MSFYFGFGFTPIIPYDTCMVYPTNYQSGLPNLALWNMSPYSLMGNFGGSYQFSTYPTEYSLQDIMACNNAANPLYYQQYFLDTFLSMINPGVNYQQEQMLAQTAQIGSAIGNSAGLDIGIKSTATTVASLKHQIESALKKTDLKDEQKSALEDLKKQVEDLEKRLEQLNKDKKSGKTIEELRQELKSINSECTKLSAAKDEELKDPSKETETVIAKEEELKDPSKETETVIAKEEDKDDTKTAAQNANSSANNVDGAVMAGASEATVVSESPDIVEAAEELIPKNSPKPVSFSDVSSVEWDNDIVGAGIDDPKITEVADGLYKLIEGSCTGGTNDEIEEFINNNINKSNVVEVMLYWNKNYASTLKDDDKYGMTESIFDDFGAFGKDAVRPIVTALQERLKEYQGINPSLYGEASSQLAIAEKEVEPSRFYEVWKICHEDKTSKAINKAHRAIVELILEKEEAENN